MKYAVRHLHSKTNINFNKTECDRRTKHLVTTIKLTRELKQKQTERTNIQLKEFSNRETCKVKVRTVRNARNLVSVEEFIIKLTINTRKNKGKLK